MATRERLCEVLTVRMPGWERFTLDQMADLMGTNRSEAMRHAIAVAMRQAMLEHPRFALHPTWVNAGNDQWAVNMYQKWACVLVADDPAAHLELVTMDGITGYKLKSNERTPKLSLWHEHFEAYRAKQRLADRGQR